MLSDLKALLTIGDSSASCRQFGWGDDDTYKTVRWQETFTDILEVADAQRASLE